MSKEEAEQIKLRTGFDLRPTNRERVYTFAPPPEDFDPMTASPRALREHGVLLRRPNPTREPKLYEAWARIYGKLWRPSLFDGPVHFERRSTAAEVAGFPQGIPIRGGGGVLHNNSSWAGCVVSGNQWVGAFGTWIVPSISIPSNLDFAVNAQKLRSSSWIGLGGVAVNNGPILQAGVDHDISATGEISYQAWVEWYPNGSDYFGMTVSAGDEIAVALQLVSTDPAEIGNPIPPAGPYQYGGINFVNVTTGKVLPFYLPSPGNSPDQGGDPFVELTAEWILEQNSPFLPKSTPITFSYCGACNAGGTIARQPQDGTVVNLVAQNVPQTSTTLQEAGLTITDLQS
jgi:hypothetical protein